MELSRWTSYFPCYCREQCLPISSSLPALTGNLLKYCQAFACHLLTKSVLRILGFIIGVPVFQESNSLSVTYCCWISHPKRSGTKPHPFTLTSPTSHHRILPWTWRLWTLSSAWDGERGPQLLPPHGHRLLQCPWCRIGVEVHLPPGTHWHWG